MRWRPRFTLRHLFAGITVIAVVLGILFSIHRLVKIDPATEKFESNGAAFEVTWNNVEWHAGRTGLKQPLKFFGPSPGGMGISEFELHQKLFQLSYTDYFGNRTFAMNVTVSGWRNSDWSDYFLHPIASGGGSVDGACELACDFDATKRELRVGVKQFINSKRLAKETELVFVWDGAKFQLQDSSGKALPQSASEQAAVGIR